jgi:hypothetical protein
VRIALDFSPVVFTHPALFGRWVVGQMRGFYEINRALIRAGLLPQLYDSGVRYEMESEETFADGAIVLARGWGDCAHLCCWRLAELHEQGETGATFIVSWATRKRGPRRGQKLYHVKIHRASGREEDPSKRLGMGRPR